MATFLTDLRQQTNDDGNDYQTADDDDDDDDNYLYDCDCDCDYDYDVVVQLRFVSALVFPSLFYGHAKCFITLSSIYCSLSSESYTRYGYRQSYIFNSDVSLMFQVSN